ncbi:LysR family transcriptional regulator [Sphingomonas sp. Root710]|uniref:LysR family transcriptional regulator ArgP n=1 Tax=Sphingomonas sp. Root710 TaxID=1736594 RepID=UPI0006FA44CD|nr:LysR family transcriptional regulator ArgP [Sphingomonas sp. Root710]KRB82910.1 LysR family transcriptional regulator [Sphingomonas sp. Root710]
MLDYASLAAVARIVRDGSFERAATSLGVTTSAISQRVRALEERLGTVLIVRGQPCKATELGRRLCAHFERVSLLEDELITDLPDLSSLSRQAPTIRIAVNADSLAAWFLPAAAAFYGATGALVDLVKDREELTAEYLRRGEVFAAVTSDQTPIQGCKRSALGALRYVATATPEFVDRWFAEGVNEASLSTAPMLRFDPRDRLQSRWLGKGAGLDFTAPTHFISSPHGYVEASLLGMGWGMNPLELVRDHLSEGRLVELTPGRYIDIDLYWHWARVGGRLLDELTEKVRQRAGKSLIPPKRS